jgi:hypothetical protein
MDIKMLSIKKYWKSNEQDEQPVKKEKKANQTKNPWLIEQVRNGLRATVVKELINRIKPFEKISPQYFENDRINGRGAYEADGILNVMMMFDELKRLTPKTIGYVFLDNKYLYHNDGILKRNIPTSEEEYYSEKTLRNENISNFFQLTHEDTEDDNGTDIDREEVHNSSTELETYQS